MNDLDKSVTPLKSFKFIDLFCGVGGFHQALANLGGECVFACDIDKRAMEVYKTNYGISVTNDITKVDEKTLPDFDVLCGGFPCVTFSKCGLQGGFNDTRGTLVFDILRILKEKRPKYFILENVDNLLTIDDGNVFKIITDNLKSLGYRVSRNPIILSPHQFNVPQCRNRIYIIGVYDPINKNSLDVEFKTERVNCITNNYNQLNASSDIVIYFDKLKKTIYDICEVNNTDILTIKPSIIETIDAWNEFYIYCKSQGKFINKFCLELIYDELSKIPPSVLEFKKVVVDFHQIHHKFLDNWVIKYNMLKKPKTYQHYELMKFNKNTLWECLIQLRPSGFRFHNDTICPTLTKSGFPIIIGKYKRYMSPRECCRLQSFPEKFILCNDIKKTYGQMGNAVNVKVVEIICKELIKIN